MIKNYRNYKKTNFIQTNFQKINFNENEHKKIVISNSKKNFMDSYVISSK